MTSYSWTNREDHAMQDLLENFDEVLLSVERGGDSFEIRAEDGHAIALLLPIQDEL